MGKCEGERKKCCVFLCLCFKVNKRKEDKIKGSGTRPRGRDILQDGACGSKQKLTSHFFFTWAITPKSELKRMRYHQNTENPNEIFIVFLGKMTVFYSTSHNKLYQLGKN